MDEMERKIIAATRLFNRAVQLWTTLEEDEKV
jgi:hypothetical protein